MDPWKTKTLARKLMHLRALSITPEQIRAVADVFNYLEESCHREELPAPCPTDMAEQLLRQYEPKDTPPRHTDPLLGCLLACLQALSLIPGPSGAYERDRYKRGHGSGFRGYSPSGRGYSSGGELQDFQRGYEDGLRLKAIWERLWQR